MQCTAEEVEDLFCMYCGAKREKSHEQVAKTKDSRKRGNAAPDNGAKSARKIHDSDNPYGLMTAEEEEEEQEEEEEAEEQATKQDAEEKATKQDAEEKATKQEAEKKAKQEAEEKAKQEAEEKATKQEAKEAEELAKAKQQNEEKAKKAEEKKAQLAEKRAKKEEEKAAKNAAKERERQEEAQWATLTAEAKEVGIAPPSRAFGYGDNWAAWRQQFAGLKDAKKAVQAAKTKQAEEVANKRLEAVDIIDGSSFLVANSESDTEEKDDKRSVEEKDHKIEESEQATDLLSSLDSTVEYQVRDGGGEPAKGAKEPSWFGTFGRNKKKASGPKPCALCESEGVVAFHSINIISGPLGVSINEISDKGGSGGPIPYTMQVWYGIALAERFFAAVSSSRFSLLLQSPFSF
jgi:hypothetical protein